MPATTKLYNERIRRGYTLRSLAEACEAKGAPVHFTTLGQIERGKNVPRPELRAVLADLLELDAVADFERAAS